MKSQLTDPDQPAIMPIIKKSPNMSLNFTIFGNHPKLSLAELLSCYPNIKKPLLGEKFALFEGDCTLEALMSRLGGTVKTGKIISTIELKDLSPEYIVESLGTKHEIHSLDFGFTVYADNLKDKLRLKQFPIQIKKALRQNGWSVRWVTGKGQEPLSPAAVSKCKLTQKPNADLCLFIIKDTVYIGRTEQVQDADAWSLRDYGRPFRNDKAGMLPPKLARMMVNLADIKAKQTILDPFCGSGTILMEAALATQAKLIIGSDIDDKQIHDSLGNTDWLIKKRILHADEKNRFKIFPADVKNLQSHLKTESIDRVISEGWLGPVLRGGERLAELQQNADAISEVWENALKTLKPLLKKQAKLVIILPSFKSGKQVVIPPVLHEFKNLGYAPLNPIDQYYPKAELYYERSGQHLRRNIFILQKD